LGPSSLTRVFFGEVSIRIYATDAIHFERFALEKGFLSLSIHFTAVEEERDPMS
jgi:hypothetical protein